MVRFMAIRPSARPFLQKFSLSSSLVLAGLLLSACSVSEDNKEDQSLLSIWSQEQNAQAKEAARTKAINKVRQEAQIEANNMATNSSWTYENDDAYRQAIKQTDIVYDEQSASFISSQQEQSARERYLYEQALKNQDETQDIFYKEALNGGNETENSSDIESPSTN